MNKRVKTMILSQNSNIQIINNSIQQRKLNKNINPIATLFFLSRENKKYRPYRHLSFYPINEAAV